MKTTNKTAWVTGASSGIGEAFAHLLAEQGYDLVLTARSEETLQQLAAGLSARHGVRAWALPGDLSLPSSAERLNQKLRELGLSVHLLVNNAGFGKWAPFLEQPLAVYEEMIALNMTALTELCYRVLPDMVAARSGGIINIASTGAYQPCPYIAVYCATKAYVLSLSEALTGEFATQGIRITAVSPGNTATGFQAAADADTTGMPVHSARYVAEAGYKAWLQGKPSTVVGTGNYLTSLAPRLLPRKTIIGIAGNMMRKRVLRRA